MIHTPDSHDGELIAVLGPTNTGKTHYAVERMLGHASGMIGFPLRLLAREVYDRVVAIKGKTRVALVTGEEKIMPANPAYFICTVEAMPLDKSVGFLAIDEIQMCADDQRGHVFTNRLLHARGSDETMFMGADTIRPLLRRLLPGIKIVERPRFSQLRYSAPKKLSRLPRRSALVAFSAENVYAAAELLRRRRGGCAIVMGALSPRTRNAQVALYQSGEVDYLVATDAIGMGLNMDIDHVVFADVRKFDGQRHRDLSAAELAQIAGRAGRHMNDGTFSTLLGGTPARNGARNGNGANGAAYGIDPQIITRIEEHNFQRLKVLMWRNARLDYRTPAALIKSLEAPATRDGLTRAGETTDLGVLRALTGEEETLGLATSSEGVQRLWEVAQLPDFRKISMGNHVRLAAKLFAFRMAGAGEIPPDWMAAQVSHLDNIQGDIDTLAARIAGIRIWTYVAHRSSWLADPAHWAGVTRAIEDKLSDALHEGLMQRFVDRRTAVLMRALKQKGDLLVDIDKDGGVSVEGHALGQLQGFAFLPDSTAGRDDQRSLKNAAERAVTREIEARAKAFATADDGDIAIEAGANLAATLAAPRLTWKGVAFAALVKGESLLRPRVKLLGNSMLEGDAAAMVLARARKWLEDRLAEQLGPLDALARELAQEPIKEPAREPAKKPSKEEATGTDPEASTETTSDEPAAPESKAPPAELSGLARGIAFRLVENLGVMPRRDVATELRQVDADARKGLHRFRIRIGASTIFMPQVLKPATTELRLMLWAIFEGLLSLPQAPTPGMVWCAVEKDVPEDFYRIAGFRKAGNKAVRVDMAERLADAVRPLGQDGGAFEVNPDIMGLVGLAGEDFIHVMRMIGYGDEKRQMDAPPLAEAKQKETKAETETEAETKAETKAETGKAEAAPETIERIFFRWRPEKTGRPRRAAKPADRRDRKAGEKPAGPGKRAQRPRRSKPDRKNSPRRVRISERAPKEVPVDENSPFAVLRGLKASLEKGRKQGAK